MTEDNVTTYEDFREGLDMVGNAEDFIELTQESSVDFREGLAMNYHTPPSAVEILSHDNKPSVRSAIAGRSSLKPEILERLLTDENMYVRKAAVGNLDISLTRLLQCLATEKYTEVQEHIIDTIQEFSTKDFEKALTLSGFNHFVGLPADWVLRAIRFNGTDAGERLVS